MIFDVDDLATVFDLNLSYEFVVVGALVGEWAHTTGFVKAAFEACFGLPRLHVSLSRCQKFCAAE